MYRKNFIGLDGFVWWMGVVESRKDPLRLGRCQVRIFGWHTDNKSLIPSADLPWAQPMIPVNQAQSYSSPKEGDYVVGFFSDGDGGQFPIMMGVLPGIPDQAPNIGKGFSDQRSEDDLAKSPREPSSIVFNTTGVGATVSEKDKADIYPNRLNEPTSGRLFRNENVANTVVGLRRTSLDKQVPTGNGEYWDEPYPAYNATPPFNHAMETESGHAFEMDDTPGSERIAMTHRTGTFFELYPSGTKVEKVVRNNYQIILGDDMIHVMGHVNITVDGDTNILSRGDVNLIGGNDLTARIAGTVDITAGENMNFKAANFTFTTPGNIDVNASVIKETSTQKNVNTGAYAESSASKNMTAGTYNETVTGESSYRWNGNKHYWTGADTYERHADGTDYSNPGDPSRSSDTSGDDVNSATPPQSAVDPDIPEAPYRATKSNPSYEQEPIPLPDLDVVPLDQVTPEQGYALKQTFGSPYGPSAANTADPVQAAQIAESQANTANLMPNENAACIQIDQLTPTEQLFSHLRFYEGLLLKAFYDAGTAPPHGNGEPMTIGYGCTAVALGRPVKFGDTETKEQAEADLVMVVNKIAVPILKNHCRKAGIKCLTQGQFNALTSLAWGMCYGMLKTDAWKLTVAGDKVGAANAFLNLNHAAGRVLNGLTKRREAEKAMYLS